MPAGYVTVALLTAKELHHADVNDLKPFCTVQIENSSWDATPEESGASPDWLQKEHVFKVTDAASTVTFTLHHRNDYGSPLLLGSTTHSLATTFEWNSERTRLQLKDADGNDAGSLNVRLEYSTTEPAVVFAAADVSDVQGLKPEDRGVSATLSGKLLETESDIKRYLDDVVSPALKSALSSLVQEKPKGPMQYLIDHLTEQKAKKEQQGSARPMFGF